MVGIHVRGADISVCPSTQGSRQTGVSASQKIGLSALSEIRGVVISLPDENDNPPRRSGTPPAEGIFPNLGNSLCLSGLCGEWFSNLWKNQGSTA
jgi:hypothetical protein